MILKQWVRNIGKICVIVAVAGIAVWWLWFMFMLLTELFGCHAGIAAGIVGIVVIAGLALAITFIERYG